MNVNKILPIVLVALILISAVQAFQLNTLKEKLEGGKLPVPSGTKSPVPAGEGVPASIANLPNMVGGC